MHVGTEPQTARPEGGTSIPLSLVPPSTISITRRPLWLELLAIGAPVFLAMAGYSAMMFIDTFMLAYLSDHEATAAGVGGAVSFVPLCFGVGTLLLVNTLVSQAFGRDDRRACGQFLWQGLWVAFTFALLLLPTCFFAKEIFLALNHPKDYVADEAIFYQILIIAAVVKLSGTVVTQFLIGVNRMVLVAIAAIVGVLFNVLGNWVLIYGNLGCPKLGVMGSALSTSLSTLVELAITTSVVFGKPMREKYFTFDFKPRWEQIKALLKMGVPAGAAMIGEVGAWTAFNAWVIPLAGLNSEARSNAFDANNYAFRWVLLSFMPAMGFGHAVTALVGRYVGRGRPDVVPRIAHLGLVMASIYMLLWGAIFLLLGQRLMRVLTYRESIQDVGATILVFMGIYQILDALYIIYNGALRGAGDTRVPAIVMITLNWSMVVAGSYAVARAFPQYGVRGPYIVLSAYGLLVGLFMVLRFQFGAWRKIDLAHLQTDPG